MVKDLKSLDRAHRKMSQMSKDGVERPNTQSVFFKSTTERFQKIDSQNPHIRILETAKAKRLHTTGTDFKPASALNISNHSTRVGTGGVVSYLSKGPDWTR